MLLDGRAWIAGEKFIFKACFIDAKMKQILHTIQDYYDEMQDIEMRYQIDTTDEYKISYELRRV